jgi:hypothetical protein
MRKLVLMLVVAGCGTALVRGEPAWGGNCLSCHGVWQSGVVEVVGADTLADPDESATGAPDRGVLKVYEIWRGASRSLELQVLGLAAGDTYAAQLKRLRFPGVTQGGALAYGADCTWPEWGDTPQYYTQPAVNYIWGEGPVTLAYEFTAAPAADADYYDLVLAVGGKYPDGTLFYDEEHFYIHVRGLIGDMDCDGAVSFADINPFVLALTNPSGYGAQFPECSRSLADCDLDGVVGFGDINAFVALLTGAKGGGV